MESPAEFLRPVEIDLMPRSLSELLLEIAGQVSKFDEPVLAHLCRMAALEAMYANISLDWEWDATDDAARPPPTADAPSDQATAQSRHRPVKPYQVWSRRSTGSYSVIVPNAKTALATVVELSAGGHSDISIRDMDGNEVELEVLRVIVEMEDNPTIRLVPR
jgi:hypothetical protein